MNELWYARRGLEVKGPFKGEVVAVLIANGRLAARDELSEDRTRWSEVCGLAGLFRERFPEIFDSGVNDPFAANPGSEGTEREADDDDHWHLATYLNAPVPQGPQRPGSSGQPGSTRPRANASGRSSERAQIEKPTGGVGLHQAAGLISIMVIIVVAGFGFLPPPGESGPNCGAPATQDVDWSNCDLSNANLKGAALIGATMRNAKLRNADLTGARLAGADMAFAEFEGSNLAWGQLASVDATGANFRGANLKYSDLRGANFSHADLTDALMGGADLRDANFDGAIWIDGRTCRKGSEGGCRVPVDPAPDPQTRRGPGQTSSPDAVAVR